MLSHRAVVDKTKARVLGIAVVDEYTVGRLDLISLHYYGSADYLDLLLKFNGIADQFECRIGKRIVVPELYSLTESITIKPNTVKKRLKAGGANAAPLYASPVRGIAASRGNGFTSGGGDLIF